MKAANLLCLFPDPWMAVVAAGSWAKLLGQVGRGPTPAARDLDDLVPWRAPKMAR